jgi:glycosyltransferase involved in cell wall biosynthesis
VADAATKPVRVGMTGAWFDPSDPRIWSGMFTHVIAELTARGVFAGYRDATPLPPVTKVVHRVRKRTGRLRDSWTLSREMQVITRASNLLARQRTPSDVGAWIVPAGGFGLPVRGRVVSWFELAPSQLERLGPSGVADFGFTGLDAEGLRFVLREQRRLHRSAHACCAVSISAAAALRSEPGIDPAKVHVIGCGRNIDIPPLADKDWASPRYLFVGNDWKRKRGDDVLRAFAQLHLEHPEAQLDLIGLHPPVDQPGVVGHGRLAFHEPADQRVMEDLFQRATCFVMPSAMEPFGIVYIEAGAAGVGSIGGSAGGTETSIGDGGILVSPGDHDALVHAMREMARPEVARAYGTSALARSSTFTWSNVAERLLRASDLTDGEGLAPFV